MPSNDDMIVATALKAKADYLITRDKDLLSLGAYEGSQIVTPEAFMGCCGKRGRGERVVTLLRL